MSGILNHSPAEIIQYYLDDQSLATLPSSDGFWPVFAGVLPTTPSNAICVYNTEGRISGREHVTGETQHHHGVQIRVRCDSYSTGYAKAMEIANNLDSLHRVEVPIASDTYMLQAVSQTTDILDLGMDDAPATRRRSFVLNALVSVRPNAGTG